jgi:pilus assembly protein CpaF
MKLRDRLATGASRPAVRSGVETSGLDKQTYNNVKTQVHACLVETLNLVAVSEMTNEELITVVRQSLLDITRTRRLPLNRVERDALVSELMDEILGLGPLEPLVNDTGVTDILVNGYAKVYVEKGGTLHPTSVQFRDNQHLMQVIDKIVSRVGRRVDESSPMVDARLPDGSRVNVIIPPLALDGPILSIRKFGHDCLDVNSLLANVTLTPEMMEYLRGVIIAKLNILISGGTGAGKTTLLNVLSGFIPPMERIITIEDSAELRLHQPHVVRLESRPPNIELKGGVTLTDLVKNSLRMRPNRIIVGETRGAEVLDMLQAMNTGHPGSMSTIHANSPRDAFSRMEIMIGMGPNILSEKGARGLIAGAINVIVQMARLPDGSRRVMSVSDVVAMEGDGIKTREIFVFEQEGVGDKGKIYGRFRATGETSVFVDHMRTHGAGIDDRIFGLDRTVR